METALLDTKEAAALYGLSQMTLRKWRCLGEGPRFVRIGRAVRYRKADLDAYADARIFESTSQAAAA